MVAKKQNKSKPIKAAKYGTLTEKEILAMAKEIEARDKQPTERMPIGTPEEARSFLLECGYDQYALPEIKPTN